MFTSAFDLVVDAISASIHRLGTSVPGVVYALLCTLGAIVLLVKRGNGLQTRTVVEALLIGFVCWLPFFAFEVIRIPYQRHQTQRAELQEANTRIQTLQDDLKHRRHNPSVLDPAFTNAWTVFQAFTAWRKVLGDEPGTLLVTWDKDMTSPVNFLDFAVRGSNLANQNFLNLGVKPEDEEAIEQDAALAANGKVVLHGHSDVRGLLQLFDALSSTIYTLELSYVMPNIGHPYPPNTIWIHVGKNVKWASEYWEEQKSKPKP